MILADLHCHTNFSHDSKAEPDEVIQTAISKGIQTLAITDHLDLDFCDYGMSLDFDVLKRKEAILQLKEKYRKDIKLIYGVELGQPYNYPDFADEVIRDGQFEFVIGSVHNLKNMPDFYFIHYSKMRFEEEGVRGIADNLFERYLNDVYKLTELPYVDTIAHCTYPCRYMTEGGMNFDIKPYYPMYEKIFKNAVKNGKMIEINTSNIRRGFGFTMPDTDILQIYKDCGGRYVTVGADAHRPHEVGADIEAGYAKARALGLEIFTNIKELY